MAIKKITEEKNLKGRRVILRLDLNVPVSGGEVCNDFRIEKVFPTIKFLKEAGAKIILISHMGKDGEQSLLPVFNCLKSKIESIDFEDKVLVDDALIKKTQELDEGGVLLFENLRKDEREKKNDISFAGELSKLGDIYVNEAFSASHREHASIVGVPALLPSYAGPLFISEIENLSRALNPEKPFYVILGGIKISTKMPLVKKFLGSADKIFLCGGPANDMFRAKGFEIGKSVSDGSVDMSELLNNEKVITPEDVIANRESGVSAKTPEDVSPEDIIVDIGPNALNLMEDSIKDAKLILWNGPLGNYEEGFKEGTERTARILAENSAFSIIGGGDTVASIEELGLSEKFGFISTGGGAMLDFLANGTLPGIKALEN